MDSVKKSLTLNEKDFLISHLSFIEKIWRSYQLNSEQLTRFSSELLDFSVRLPLVGSFSAGKSSLINFLLNDRLLATNLNPETCLPAEIHYSSDERITLHVPNKTPTLIERSKLKDLNFRGLPENTWLDIAAPFPAMIGLDTITLVDMPGWSSGNDHHSQAIENYLWRSSAYCLVVSVDEGGLKDSLKRIIEELGINKKPMMLVITKADKKPFDEVDTICKCIQFEVESIYGMPLLSVSVVNRRDTTQFLEALQQLVPLNAQLFHQRVGLMGVSLLGDLLLHLAKLRNSNNFTIDQIKDQRETLLKEQITLHNEIEQTDQKLRSALKSVENYINNEFENRLKNRLEYLASALLSDGDIEGCVSSELRMAYTSGVEHKLKQQIKHRLKDLEDRSAEILNDINVGQNFTLNSENRSGFGNLLSDVFSLLLNVFKRISWLAPVTDIVINLFSSLFTHLRQEIAREQRLEEARHYVLNELIPKCMRMVHRPINEALNDNINSIMQSVRKEIDCKIENYKLSLLQLTLQLEKEQTEDHNYKARIQLEYDTISTILDELKEYANA